MTERQRKTGSRILTAIILSVLLGYVFWMTLEFQQDPVAEEIVTAQTK